jgi:hypothetical protein
MTATAAKEIVQTFEKVFEPIDREKLHALSEKGRM